MIREIHTDVVLREEHSYRRFIDTLQKYFWTMPEARLIKDKRAAYRAVGELQPDARIPRQFPLPASYVIKPHNQCSSKGVTLVHNGQLVMGAYHHSIVEEMIVDPDGFTPPRQFLFFCFNNLARFLIVQTRSERQDTYHLHLPGYGEPEQRSLTRVESQALKSGDYPLPEIEAPALNQHAVIPSGGALDRMLHAAEHLSSLFSFPVRVDFYWDGQMPVFGEFCATPGFQLRVNREWDQQLGYWCATHTTPLPGGRQLPQRM